MSDSKKVPQSEGTIYDPKYVDDRLEWLNNKFSAEKWQKPDAPKTDNKRKRNAKPNPT